MLPVLKQFIQPATQKITIHQGTINTVEDIPKLDVLVVADYSIGELIGVDAKMREKGTRVVFCEIRGLSGLLFSDFGSVWSYLKSPGRECADFLIKVQQ